MKFTTRLSAKPKRRPSDRLQFGRTAPPQAIGRRLGILASQVRHPESKGVCSLARRPPRLCSHRHTHRMRQGPARANARPAAGAMAAAPSAPILPCIRAARPRAPSPSLRTGLVECLVLCCALDLKLTSCVPVRFSWISGYYARSGPRCAPPSLLPFLVPAAAFSRPSFSDMYMCRVLACRRAAGEARATSTSSTL